MPDDQQTTVLQDVVHQLDADGVQFLYHELEGLAFVISSPGPSHLAAALSLALKTSRNVTTPASPPFVAAHDEGPPPLRIHSVPACTVCAGPLPPNHRRSQKVCSPKCRKRHLATYRKQRRSTTGDDDPIEATHEAAG